MKENILPSDNSIQDIIYDIRGVKVMLDYDLAALYGVETRTLNQAVKRNIERFPQDFMFRLTENEWGKINCNLLSDNMPSQIVIASSNQRNKSAPPYAFTEHGAVMLASVLTCATYSRISDSRMSSVFIHQHLCFPHFFLEQLHTLFQLFFRGQHILDSDVVVSCYPHRCPNPLE